jgi:OOP family OmpA-OmpF porin
MNKYLTATAALALASACTSSFAQDAGAFFINAGVGQSQYHVDDTDTAGYATDNGDTAAALRVGYLWRGPMDFGVEGGYADLGKLKASLISGGVLQEVRIHSKGWLLGATGKYHFADQWFVSARAGWLHTSSDVDYRVSTPVDAMSASNSVDGDGWYGGMGVGYDVSSSFSLGVNYDDHHVEAKTGNASADANVGTWIVTAEYRF